MYIRSLHSNDVVAYRTFFLPSWVRVMLSDPLPMPPSSFTLTLGIGLMAFVNYDIVVCVFPGQNSLGISAHKTLPLGLRTLAFGTEEIKVV